MKNENLRHAEPLCRYFQIKILLLCSWYTPDRNGDALFSSRINENMHFDKQNIVFPVGGYLFFNFCLIYRIRRFRSAIFCYRKEIDSWLCSEWFYQPAIQVSNGNNNPIGGKTEHRDRLYRSFSWCQEEASVRTDSTLSDGNVGKIQFLLYAVDPFLIYERTDNRRRTWVFNR